MEWAQAAIIIAATTGLIGLRSFWIARELDALRGGLDRLDTRLERLEGREPPSLRRV